ncbi:MAG: oxaloacetate decarboxylase [Chthoniobacterales bacterium]
MPTSAEKRLRFRELHTSGCFTVPNPWDIGSARYLQHLGFKAIASSSAGFAFSQGLPDYAVPLGEMLSHLRELVENTDIPVNADFENGFADAPEAVARNVRLCLETGVAGLSIEDATGDLDAPLYGVAEAADRIAAAKSAIGGSNAVLVGRAECFLVDQLDIDQVIRRLCAYAEAGADCLYAPGVSKPDDIRAIVAAVAPKPVNLLISSAEGLTIAEAAALGVRRVSVGGALARASWGGFMRAANDLARGHFDGFNGAASHSELNSFMAENSRPRQSSSASES